MDKRQPLPWLMPLCRWGVLTLVRLVQQASGKCPLVYQLLDPLQRQCPQIHCFPENSPLKIQPSVSSRSNLDMGELGWVSQAGLGSPNFSFSWSSEIQPMDLFISPSSPCPWHEGWLSVKVLTIINHN